MYTRQEHRINVDEIDADALRIIERLHSNGHEAYIVGGAVRDLMIGKRPKDFDIVTDATPTRIKRLFRNARIIGRRFRLVHIFFGPTIYEIATFRSLVDGTAGNTFGTIDEDVKRRDFTINALFYDPREQVVVDYVGGVKDIRKRVIKPVIDLDVIFKDDPVRLVRAAKYAATTGFAIPFLLRHRMKKEAHLLEPVSPSRLTEEIQKILHSGKARAIVEQLDSLGLYRYLQPNAARLMRENKVFRSCYLDSLSALDAKVADGTQQENDSLLAFFIKDYLDTLADWGRENGEHYPELYADCRSYVLPMNPPRLELEHAVRCLFRANGVQVKRGRRIERVQGSRGDEAIEPGAEDASLKKRRRRRRRRRVQDAPNPQGPAQD